MRKFIILLALPMVFACHKSEKTTSLFRIEGSGSNINRVEYSSLDTFSKQINDYDNPNFVHEWQGKAVNHIIFSISTGDQTGVARLYIDNKLIQESTCPDNQTGVLINWKN